MYLLKTCDLNEDQCSQVIELAVQRLSGGREYIFSVFDNLINSRINHFWLLAVDSSGKIQGFCNLRPKRFMIHGQYFDVLGASFMVTSKLKFSPSAADSLRNYLFKESDNYDFIVGFARKKMDYYWSRFGFLGLGCYPCLELALYDIEEQKVNSTLKISDYNYCYLRDICKLYDSLSWLSPHYFKRTFIDWKFLISNLPRRKNTHLHVVISGCTLVGYFVSSENNILELFCVPDHFPSLINALKAFFQSNYDKVYIKLPDSHLFVAILKQFSHTYSSRLAFEGGHILKVSNPRSVLCKLEIVIHRKLSQSSTPSGSLSVFNDVAKVCYRQGMNSTIAINPEQSIDSFLRNIFISTNVHDLDSVFRLGELFFPWLDHF